MDATAERQLLDQARWLTDRQTARLASLESRASAIIAWSGVQITFTLAAVALARTFPDTDYRTGGIWALIAAVACLTAAVLTAILGVFLVRTVAAPEPNLVACRQELADHTADTRNDDLSVLLLDMLMKPTADRKAVVPDLADDVDTRAVWLRRSVIGLAAAVLLDAAAAIALSISAIQ